MELKKDIDQRGEQIDKVLNNADSTVQEIVQLYDSWNETYDKDMEYFGYYLEKQLDEFEDITRIHRDARILDVAAGTGIVGELLSARGFTNLDALDGSQGMLAKAKEKGVYKNYINAWLGPDPIEGAENNAYDALICFGGLDVTHVNQTCFQSLAAITKPGGYIFFVGAETWLFDQKDQFEDKMRQLEKDGTWKWILMKHTQDKYDQDEPALLYAFKVLK